MKDFKVTNAIPTLSVDLIEQLARDIPALRIKPTDPIAKVMFKAGQRDLVETLMERLKLTNDLGIEGTSSIHA